MRFFKNDILRYLPADRQGSVLSYRRKIYSAVAQLVERLAVNEDVLGSSPSRGATIAKLAKALGVPIEDLIK